MNPTPLSKEPPSRLAWLFKAAERSSHRRSGDLLLRPSGGHNLARDH